jgi:hypothetical protein
MTPPKIEEKKILNGSYGRLYVDGSMIGEVSAVKLVAKITDEEVQQVGSMEPGRKIMKLQGVGSFKFKKVFTRFQEVFAGLKLGKDVGFTMMAKIDDPDAYGVEGFAAVGCKFKDDFPLLDFEVGKLGELEYNFTFRVSDSDWVDRIIHADMF